MHLFYDILYYDIVWPLHFSLLIAAANIVFVFLPSPQ